MKCPNNEECTIVFYAEENDRGDPSTPYFESYTVYLYDIENSEHMQGCPTLTDDQIKELEEAINNNPYDYLADIYEP